MKKITQEQFNQIKKEHTSYLSGRSASKDFGIEEVKLGTRMNLSDHDLSHLDLRNTNFTFAILNYAKLSDDLSGCIFRFAQLRFANLRGVNMSRASWNTAILEGANIDGAKLPKVEHMPLKGSFRAFKRVYDSFSKLVILEIEIPAEAQRIACITSNNCRSDFVSVIGIAEQCKRRDEKSFRSWHDPGFLYHLTSKPVLYYPRNGFDTNPTIDICPGIHYNMTFKEANAW